MGVKILKTLFLITAVAVFSVAVLYGVPRVRTYETRISCVKVLPESENCSIPVIGGGDPAENDQKLSAFYRIDEAALSAINNDYAAWICIPETQISYPVVKGHDNTEYLHKSFETNGYSYPGTLFFDAACNENCPMIIYGHNMRDGSMFGSLKKLRGRDLITDPVTVHLYIKGENEPRVYRAESAKELSADSVLNVPEGIDLRLVTCCGKDNERFIVDCRRFF